MRHVLAHDAIEHGADQRGVARGAETLDRVAEVGREVEEAFVDFGAVHGKRDNGSTRIRTARRGGERITLGLRLVAPELRGGIGWANLLLIHRSLGSGLQSGQKLTRFELNGTIGYTPAGIDKGKEVPKAKNTTANGLGTISGGFDGFYALELSKGATIGSGGAFNSEFPFLYASEGTNYWAVGDTGYLGLEISVNGQTDYGWAEVTLNGLPGSAAAATGDFTKLAEMFLWFPGRVGVPPAGLGVPPSAGRVPGKMPGTAGGTPTLPGSRTRLNPPEKW